MTQKAIRNLTALFTLAAVAAHREDAPPGQCAVLWAGGISFCEPNPPHLVGPIKITSEGTLPPTSFTVFTGTVGNRTCGTSKKDKNCYVGVGNAEGSNNDSALAKIKFVP